MTPLEPRPDLAKLEPYRSSETAGGRIFLHANENPHPLPPEVSDEILEATASLRLNRYPAPEPTDLVTQLATYAGVDPSWIWTGDGSNEVLLQACLAYGGPGRTAMLFEPTYVMHERQARIAGTHVESVARRADFSLDVGEAVEAIERTQPHLVFVCSPNNPTGTVSSLEDIRAIARTSTGLVLVDEAYFEFSGVTLVPYLAEHPNVIVVRTLSKAFRLAGIRLGYGIGAPSLLEHMRRVRLPYGLSAFTQSAATIVLRHREKVLEVVAGLITERDRVSTALAEQPGVDVFPSGANFVFFRHRRSDELLAVLAKDGIVIRDFRHLAGCSDCLRVTTGSPPENDAFLAVAATVS